MNNSHKLTRENFPSGIATTAELKAKGFNNFTINALYNDGELIRIRRGVYKIKNLSSDDKRNIIRAAIPQGIFCLSSALYIHYPTKNVKGEIKEKTRPHKHELAVPRGHVHSKINNFDDIEINLHYIKPEHHEIGKMISEDGLSYYDLERTICDYFKNHSRFSYRWLREIARNYNKDNRRNTDKLLEYREQLNLSQLAKLKMDWLIFRDNEAQNKLFKKRKDKNYMSTLDLFILSNLSLFLKNSVHNTWIFNLH